MRIKELVKRIIQPLKFCITSTLLMDKARDAGESGDGTDLKRSGHATCYVVCTVYRCVGTLHLQLVLHVLVDVLVCGAACPSSSYVGDLHSRLSCSILQSCDQ